MWKVSNLSQTEGIKLSIIRQSPRKGRVKKTETEIEVRKPTQLELLLQQSKQNKEKIPMGTEMSLPQKSLATKQFICLHCNSEQKSAHLLITHIRSHTDESRFNKSFKQPFNRDDHNHTQTEKKLFSCRFCERQFNQQINLSQHVKRVHFGEESPTCQLCLISFKSRDDLKIHLLAHSGQPPLRCRHCPLVFAYKRFLQLHELSHAGDKSHTCKYCSRRFKFRQVLLLHENKCEQNCVVAPIKSEFKKEDFQLPELCHTDITPVEDDYKDSDHENEEFDVSGYPEENSYAFSNGGDDIVEPVFYKLEHQNETSFDFEETFEDEVSFQLPFESKNCFQESDLDLHSRVHAPDYTNPHICRFCNRTFQSKEFLAAHEVKHAENETAGRFQCSYCPRILVTRQTLKYHERTHTGERPYPCPYCNRKFARTGTLNTHIKQHTGDKPYVCNLCGKSFARASVLSIHERSHAGHKRYRCQSCGVGFNDRRRMEAHEQMHCRVQTGSEIQMENHFLLSDVDIDNDSGHALEH